MHQYEKFQKEGNYSSTANHVAQLSDRNHEWIFNRMITDNQFVIVSFKDISLKITGKKLFEMIFLTMHS